MASHPSGRENLWEASIEKIEIIEIKHHLDDPTLAKPHHKTFCNKIKQNGSFFKSLFSADYHQTSSPPGGCVEIVLSSPWTRFRVS